MKTIKTNIIVTLLLLITVSVAQAQRLTMPEPSQDASITQRLGISDVTIKYNSPGTLGRKIFGGIVPYNAIWRAGANENTTISFSHDAKIEGKYIKAGTYGLYMIPGKQKFEIIFSKKNKNWGTVLPTKNDTALRVSVTPKNTRFQERLGYNFTERTANSLVAVLDWANMRIPFKIEFNVIQIVINNAIVELEDQTDNSEIGYMQLATYCLQNNTHLDEAMVWAEKSISRKKTFSNLKVKADLLSKKGQKGAAKKIMDEAFPIGGIWELNSFGYSLLNDNKTKEAIKVFLFNIKKHSNDPTAWRFIDSLGEAYLKDGNKKKALKYYKKAKSKAPADQHAYFDSVIARIK
jgi:tetratricopeptide (TPR) repeat protein